MPCLQAAWRLGLSAGVLELPAGDWSPRSVGDGTPRRSLSNIRQQLLCGKTEWFCDPVSLFTKSDIVLRRPTGPATGAILNPSVQPQRLIFSETPSRSSYSSRGRPRRPISTAIASEPRLHEIGPFAGRAGESTSALPGRCRAQSLNHAWIFNDAKRLLVQCIAGSLWLPLSPADNESLPAPRVRLAARREVPRMASASGCRIRHGSSLRADRRAHRRHCLGRDRQGGRDGDRITVSVSHSTSSQRRQPTTSNCR